VVIICGLVLYFLKRKRRGDKVNETQPLGDEDEKTTNGDMADGAFVPHTHPRPADGELSEWVGRLP
jgi:hypothetical protein